MTTLSIFVFIVVMFILLASATAQNQLYFFNYFTTTPISSILDGSFDNPPNGNPCVIKDSNGAIISVAFLFQYDLPTQKRAFVTTASIDDVPVTYPGCIELISNSAPILAPTACLDVCGGASLCRCENGTACTLTTDTTPCLETSTCTPLPTPYISTNPIVSTLLPSPSASPSLSPSLSQIINQSSLTPSTRFNFSRFFSQNAPTSTCVATKYTDYKLTEILLDLKGPRTNDTIQRLLGSWLSFCLSSVEFVFGDVTHQLVYIYGTTTPTTRALQTCSYANLQLIGFTLNFSIRGFASPVENYSMIECSLALAGLPSLLQCGTKNDLNGQCSGKKCSINENCRKSSECAYGVCHSGRCFVPADWDLISPPDQSLNKSTAHSILISFPFFILIVLVAFLLI